MSTAPIPRITMPNNIFCRVVRLTVSELNDSARVIANRVRAVRPFIDQRDRLCGLFRRGRVPCEVEHCFGVVDIFGR